MKTGQRDLFGEIRGLVPGSKAERRRIAELRKAAAIAEIPKVLFEINKAREAAEPYEQAFREAHQGLLAMVEAQGLTKSEKLAGYDRRLHAGHAWWPYKQAVVQAQDWLAALQKEIKDCEMEIGIKS